MPLTIYGIARSRASRALWMAEELGVPYTHVPVAVRDGGVRQPDFLALNPNGRIPTIDDDGTIVWESVAINLHLAKRYPSPLGPRDLSEDAAMTMWSVFAIGELEPPAHDVLLHTIGLPPERRDPAMAQDGLSRLERPLAALETALARGDGHLVGGRFTVADLNVACMLFYLRAVPEAMAPTPAVAALWAEASARPAYMRMMALRDAEAV